MKKQGSQIQGLGLMGPGLRHHISGAERHLRMRRRRQAGRKKTRRMLRKAGGSVSRSQACRRHPKVA